MSSPVLEVRDLRCERDDRLLFDALSFALPAGGAMQLRGPNGAGKTTLLRAVAGLHPDYEGRIRIAGAPVGATAGGGAAQFLFVGHRAGITAALTAAENLRWHLALAGLRAAEDDLARALERVGLGGWDEVVCQQMSAGQQRRVSLARLALDGPDVPLWILDEPFTALDDGGMVLIRGLIEQHLEHGGAVLFATHQPLTGLERLSTLWIGPRSSDVAAPGDPGDHVEARLP